MKLYSLIVVFFVLVISHSCFSQDIVGFWEISKVEVDTNIMTPVAKWTKINEDGSYQSGNGWLQNSVGNWTYDQSSKRFTPVERHGIKDKYGPFTVSFTDSSMIWTRKEEGVKVRIILSKIEQMPMSTADKIAGLWDLNTTLKNNTDITSVFDPDDNYYLFIRWDRIYIRRTPVGERSTGYWHINAHRPELTFVSHDKNEEIQSWKVSVTEMGLQLSGISDSNQGMKLKFNRLNRFPE